MNCNQNEIAELKETIASMQSQIKAMQTYILSNRRELEEHITPLALGVVDNPSFLAKVAEKAAIADGSLSGDTKKLKAKVKDLEDNFSIAREDLSELLIAHRNFLIKYEKDLNSIMMGFKLQRLVTGWLLKNIIPLANFNNLPTPDLIEKVYQDWIEMQGDNPIDKKNELLPMTEAALKVGPIPTPKPQWKVYDWELEDQGMLYFILEDKKRQEYCRKHGKTLRALASYLGCQPMDIKRAKGRLQDWIAYHYPEHEPHYKVKCGPDKIAYFPIYELEPVFMILTLTDDTYIGANNWRLKVWEPNKLRAFYDGEVEIIKTKLKTEKLPLKC